MYIFSLRKDSMEKITVIIPCYNEEETIPVFVEEMEKVYTSKIGRAHV